MIGSPDGSYYGEYVDGQFHGKGMWLLENGGYVKGEFLNGEGYGYCHVRHVEGNTVHRWEGTVR